MAGVKQFDERAVLEKAMEAFRRKGFAETSMVDLARTTKVQRGSLYNAFADKEAIFLKAYDLEKPAEDAAHAVPQSLSCQFFYSAQRIGNLRVIAFPGNSGRQ